MKRLAIFEEDGTTEIGGVRYKLVPDKPIAFVQHCQGLEPRVFLADQIVGDPRTFRFVDGVKWEPLFSAAATPDLSALPVVPERRTQSEDERYRPDAHYECGLTDGFNEALAAIGVKP